MGHRCAQIKKTNRCSDLCSSVPHLWLIISSSSTRTAAQHNARMNRRQFLRAAAATTVAPLVLPNVVSAAAEEKSDDRLILCAPLTHSDWMLKPNIQWGEPGVRHMLDACKAAGWSRVMWRVADAGQATYASKLMKP